jgi:YVTN family beta-propeller protein
VKFESVFRPLAAAVAVVSCVALPASAQAPAKAPAPPPAPAVATVPGMPPVANAANLYSETTADKLSPAVAGDLPRVYVPHIQSNDVYVIDPATFQVVDKFKVGLNPQHVVPSWDLRTLWVANNAENTTKGSLTPVDPKTGKPGKPIAVDDPYNMYFSPDGKSAIVTCEFTGTVAKIDLVERKVLGYTQVIQPGRPTKTVKGPDGKDEIICTTWKGMPQDIRASPDGKRFYVADMMADGVHVVDLESFRQVGFIETGKGTHGLYPSRDGKKLYVANRGSRAAAAPTWAT